MAATPAVGLGPRRGRGRRPHAALWMVSLTASALLVSGCASGKDAVVTGGTFQFVAPGGQSIITYDPPRSRGSVTGLSGDDLLHPGHTIGIADFPGQVVVLNIWGSWCGPCRIEAPDLQATYQSARSSGVMLLGIDVRDDRGAATDFVRAHQLSYPQIFDPPGRSLSALRGFPRNTVPSTIVLDRAHRVAAIFLTRIRISQLLPVVQRIAAEPSTPTPAPASGGVGR